MKVTMEMAEFKKLDHLKEENERMKTELTDFKNSYKKLVYNIEELKEPMTNNPTAIVNIDYNELFKLMNLDEIDDVYAIKMRLTVPF